MRPASETAERPRSSSVGTTVRAAGLLGLVLVLGGCSEVDVEQLKLCERLIPAFVDPTAEVAIERRALDPTAANAVILHYRTEMATEPADARWISCRFGGRGFERDRLRLIGVATDGEGVLSEVRVFFLRQFWLGLYEAQTRAPFDQGGVGAGGLRSLLYALQLALNALTIGSIYGLLALGYTLVYRVVDRINLAFGEMAMVGAYVTFLGVTVLAIMGTTALPLGLMVVLVVTAGIGAVHGMATERLIFRPLRQATSQAALIATIGLAIVLQETVRLLQGAEDRWIQPVFSATQSVAVHGDFVVTVSLAQGLVLLLCAALCVGLWRLIGASRFGRDVRACADDPQMAALCGVNVDRTIALTFALGTGYAAIAGFITLLRYGGVGFYDGYLLGFKALTAAILGGIGSLPGAMLGGLLIGGLETFWAGYLVTGYKDVAIFAVLAIVLILRPNGLFGRPVRLVNDRFWRPRT